MILQSLRSNLSSLMAAFTVTLRHIQTFTLGICCLLVSHLSFAQQASAEDSPQVGKHVMANMDAGSMILSLLMVLALIVISASLLKRFNLVQQGTSQLKVISSLSLGAKERLVVVQVGDKQLLLGVTANQVNLIETLSDPLVQQSDTTATLPANIMSLIQKKLQK